MNDLETVKELNETIIKSYYDLRHKQLENEIQRDNIKALEYRIKELTHRLIEQEIELSRLIKKVI